MNYYFVSATSAVGPVHFPVFVDCFQRGIRTLTEAIGAEAARRGLVFCCDWEARPIDGAEFERLMW